MFIEKIKSPANVKALKINELETLSHEIREALIQKISTVGGHCGPNLGFVEATIALHYVFESPKDKIIYDVSHQSYTHKILTGRNYGFLDSQKYCEITGYTEPSESNHDFFTIGHTSTSISLALGLATARDIKNENGNVVAVIGDGSLSGGEAFEGLDNAGEYASNFIVVVNDNEMSIAENHGGLYKNLKELRDTKGKATNNYFKSLGFDYLYVENGNHIQTLIDTFEKIKDSKKPIVVHIHTIKGMGYAFAETNKESWHWAGPFDIKTGAPKNAFSESYSEILGDYLLKKIKTDKDVVVINAAVPGAIGFNKKRRLEAGKQFIDVGIAEEHAIALASGLAKGGVKSVFNTHSTFFQRTYDQLSQDLCINKSPATLLVTMSGADGMNDVTHLCIFDIAMMSNIPNMVYLCPTCVEEALTMIEFAINQTAHPIAIRIPNNLIHRSIKFENDYSKLNLFKVDKLGKDVALIGLGDYYHLAEQVAHELEKSKINATIINPRFATGIDNDLLKKLKENHSIIVTLENGVVDGGFGQNIATYYSDSLIKVLVKGLKKEFYDKVSYDELVHKNRLTPTQIAEDVLKLLAI